MLNKRFLPATIAACLLGAVGIVGYLVPDDVASTPQRAALPNSGGAVVFEHATHEKLGLKCAQCHHVHVDAAKQAIACDDCHGKKFDEAFVKDHAQRYAKEFCSSCHHYEPGQHDWGHKAHKDDMGLECTSCHHRDTSIEDKPQNCSSCHEEGKAPSREKPEAGMPPSLADAVHARCAGCHKEWFGGNKARSCAKCHSVKAPEGGPAPRLHKNLATMKCSGCHDREPGKLIPGRMEASHKLCMDCHDSMKKGPGKKAPCTQCHLK